MRGSWVRGKEIFHPDFIKSILTFNPASYWPTIPSFFFPILFLQIFCFRCLFFFSFSLSLFSLWFLLCFHILPDEWSLVGFTSSDSYETDFVISVPNRALWIQLSDFSDDTLQGRVPLSSSDISLGFEWDWLQDDATAIIIPLLRSFSPLLITGARGICTDSTLAFATATTTTTDLVSLFYLCNQHWSRSGSNAVWYFELPHRCIFRPADLLRMNELLG